MTTLKQICFASVLVFSLLATAAAQDSTNTTAQRSTLTITAAATGDRVRITAPSSVVQMRVEVYAASGEKLFDQEIRGGNVFDWHLQDGQAQRLALGTYVCVVTAKSISGKLTQKIGAISVAEKSASVQSAESQQLSAPQAQTIGPVEENSSWTIPAKDEPQTGTVIANDGTDGQMIRGRGALTFRIGNFFSGADTEQMRLTEEGNLGIGTSEPKAKLDVAGTIRAERVLIAKPRPVGVDKTDTLAPDDANSVQPLVAGAGTQNRIAKWTDNAGTLGDSAITETGGFVGIGTTTPGSKLVVSANTAPLPAASGVARFADADGVQTAVFADAFGTNPIFNVRRANGTAAVPSAVQANQLLGVIGASGYGASAYMGTRARVAFLASENWTNTANGSHITFNTTANGAATAGGTERLRIDNAGNVGIGTTSPAAKLDVTGDINTSTQYNIAGNRILSTPGTTNIFAGQNAGAANTGGGTNAFFGTGAGFHNTNGSTNAFFGDGAGFSNTIGNWNTMIGAGADVGSGNLTNATAIGRDAQVDRSNSIVLGSIAGVNGAAQNADTNVGIGTTSPAERLTVQTATGNYGFVHTDGNIIVGSYVGGSTGGGWYGTKTNHPLSFFVNDGSPSLTITTGGLITIPNLSTGGTTALCLNAANLVSNCNASSLRYKTNVQTFIGGMDVVNRLRPISFSWKEGGMHDIGLGAEEVAKVAPMLTFRNNKGEIEGVKYNQLSAVFINAFKEQQAQIQRQQEQIKRQREEFAALRKLVCRSRSRARACKS